MAGYSGTPLPQKLGIKPGHRVALLGAPPGFDKALGSLPPAASTTSRLSANLDVILIFVKDYATFEDRFDAARKNLAQAGGLWVCWPKKASGVPTDLNENLIRELGLSTGLVDNKVCAVDDTWSGLRFVIRLADRKSLPKPPATARPAPPNPRSRSRSARRP